MAARLEPRPTVPSADLSIACCTSAKYNHLGLPLSLPTGLLALGCVDVKARDKVICLPLCLATFRFETIHVACVYERGLWAKSPVSTRLSETLSPRSSQVTPQQCSLEFEGGREHHEMCRRKEKEAISLTEPGTQLQGSCSLYPQRLQILQLAFYMRVGARTQALYRVSHPSGPITLTDHAYHTLSQKPLALPRVMAPTGLSMHPAGPACPAGYVCTLIPPQAPSPHSSCLALASGRLRGLLLLPEA